MREMLSLVVGSEVVVIVLGVFTYSRVYGERKLWGTAKAFWGRPICRRCSNPVLVGSNYCEAHGEAPSEER